MRSAPFPSRLGTAIMAAAFAIAAQTPLQLTVNQSTVIGSLDLTRYSLGQGGLSSKPMIDTHIADLVQLHSKTNRFFMQEYFNLLPAHNTYHWGSLDSMLDAIVATGAQPIADICFKPKVLYPTIDPNIVTPNSWAEWDTLIVRLVQHCRQKAYGIKYWEIGNEGDVGEVGGCPYQFTSQNYIPWYQHTANAILSVDPTAKVGGPALGSFRQDDPIGGALISQAANGSVPLHFFTWHGYTNNPSDFTGAINDVKGKLAQHASLANVETIITEWNFDLGNTNPDPAFQPAFILEATRNFLAAGLSSGNYYHITDYLVNQAEFEKFMTQGGASAMAGYWNNRAQCLGIYSNQGVMRPAYYAFLMMSRMKGPQISVTGTNNDVKAFAVKNADSIDVLVWNYGGGTSYNVTLGLPSTAAGSFKLSRLNAANVRIDAVRQGQVSELQATPLTFSLSNRGIYWLHTALATASDRAIQRPSTNPVSIMKIVDMRGRGVRWKNGDASPAPGAYAAVFTEGTAPHKTAFIRMREK
jgi:beta-xylosidase